MNKRFEPVTWSDEMSVGVDIIDKDHKKLLSLLNEMNYIINAEASSTRGEIVSVLSELIDYTKYHFNREEILMDACNYPELTNHKHAHEVLIGQVRSFMTGFEQEHSSFDPMALHIFLEEWFVEHILKMDKDYVSWVSGNQDFIEKILKES